MLRKTIKGKNGVRDLRLKLVGSEERPNRARVRGRPMNLAEQDEGSDGRASWEI